MTYRAFSRDVTVPMLVFQNKETAAILVYQNSPLGHELYLYAKLSFVSINQDGCLSRPWKRSVGLHGMINFANGVLTFVR